jgi:hypothetical protein
MTDGTPDIPPALAETAALERLANRLEAARPSMAPTYRAQLGSAVATESRRRHLRPRPPHLWPIVALCAGSGAALLAAAASQL